MSVQGEGKAHTSTEGATKHKRGVYLMTIPEQAMVIAESAGIRFCGAADWSSVGYGIMLWFIDPLTGSSFPMQADSLSAETVRRILMDMRSKDWETTSALRELGYSNEEIASMKAEDALALINKR